jgi:allantoin racemase
MLIHVVNPNSTAAMTARIAAAARRVAGAGVTVRADNPPDGPAAIEGPYDGALAVPGLLRCLAAAAEAGADAHVIACFDDTGLDAARALCRGPVVGIGEAAFHLASLVAERFSVVTTLSRSVPTIEANLMRYGLAARTGRVRASEVPVLDLEAPGSAARRRVSDEIARALAEDRVGAVVLGCAGMADFVDEMSAAHGVPIVDGVAAAVALAEALVRLRLATSKTGGWASPHERTACPIDAAP